MCHIKKDSTFTTVASTTNPALVGTKLTMHKPRLSPFRRIAKSARINLNRYWGLLSQKHQFTQPKQQSNSTSMSTEIEFSVEEEQNRMNELMEAQANAEEQNSINSQIEYDSSPEQPRRLLFVRQRALTSTSSFSSSSFSYDFDNLSQDSVFF